MASPVPLSLCRPRGNGCPRRKRGPIKVPTRPTHAAGAQQLTFQEPSRLPEEGRAEGGRVRTHGRKGLGGCVGSLSLMLPGRGGDEDSHSICIHSPPSLTEAPFPARKPHNVPLAGLHEFSSFMGWEQEDAKETQDIFASQKDHYSTVCPQMTVNTQDCLAYLKAIYLVSFESLEANQKSGQRARDPCYAPSEQSEEGLPFLSTKGSAF